MQIVQAPEQNSLKIWVVKLVFEKGTRPEYSTEATEIQILFYLLIGARK